MDERVTRLYKYCDAVLAGDIIACKEVIQACERSKKDLQKSLDDPDYPYWFDPAPGIKYESFVSKFRHVEGSLVGTPIVLLDWQVWTYGQILGWKKRKDNFRRFRQAHIEVPRGNFKSYSASTLALYFLALDNEGGPQVYSVATSQKQARIVFDKANEMLQNEDKLGRFLGLKSRAHDIRLDIKRHNFTNKGVFMPLASSGQRLDGLNIHLCVIDELHAIKDRTVYDKMITGSAKRTQSLILCITTAGYDISSIGFIQNQYAKNILSGRIEDDSLFCCIWKADDEDDEFSVETLKKANPCFDYMDQERLQITMRRAQNDISEKIPYAVLHLNKWQSSGDSFFDVAKLSTGYDPELSVESFKEQKCYVGVDMAVVDDMCCVTQCFFKDEKLYVFPKYFLPEATINAGKNASYQEWEKKGWLESIPGPVINQDVIFNYIKEINENFDVGTNVVDRAGDTEILSLMAYEGYNVFHADRGYSLSNPTKKLQSLILQEKVIFNNQIFMWNCMNACVQTDRNDNVFLAKTNKSSDQKIDGVMCVVYALGPIIENEILPERGMFWSIPG